VPPFGAPRDPAAWLALALAALALALGPRVLRSGRDRLLVAGSAIAASLLSAAYVAVYLRGGPRIIDASAYFLSARAMAEGLFSFPIGEPETSILGRFLVRHETAEGARAAVIFPPGWPAILALGFLARAPLAVAPLLAAAIAVVTFDLTRRLAEALDLPDSSMIPKVSAILSASCAALRYHTADTMSHGLAALCFAGALALAMRAMEAEGRRAIGIALGAGLAAGWLFATRPVSAVALGIALAVLLVPRRAARLAIPIAIAIGAIPGVLLFFVHQRAATGAWGVSSQRLYYELSDGPPGCFRYGFGAGIGCLGEHGDFVKARLADGFGAIAAAGTTLRRLKMHLVDPMNAEPLALLVVGGAFVVRRAWAGRALVVAVIAQILVYAPFYFDGNYPGGGGRFFCDVLPVEHALAAAAIVAIAERTKAKDRWIAGLVALSFVGFAVRASFDHALLRDRDGGRPLFEPEAVTRAGVTRGVVFVDSDHGFDLAYDPAPRGDLVFARLHGDSIDRLAWEARGRPPAYRYRFVPWGEGLPSIEPIAFDERAPLVLEGESLWPPIAQERGYAQIAWASGSCASGSRWLSVHAAGEDAKVTLGLPARALAGRTIAPRVAVSMGAQGSLTLVADGVEVARRVFGAPLPGRRPTEPVCLDLPGARVPHGARRLRLVVAREGGGVTSREGDGGGLVALDRLTVPFAPPREND
jgi:hypothetical protein